MTIALPNPPLKNIVPSQRGEDGRGIQNPPLNFLRKFSNFVTITFQHKTFFRILSHIIDEGIHQPLHEVVI